MTLNPMCDNVETKQGVPLTVTGVAQVKIMKDPALLEIAAEQFLGKKEDEITETILQTLEGHLRAILGTLTVEEVYKDRDQFANLVRDIAKPDVGKMGIDILSFTIKDVYDNVDYLASLGKSQTAAVKRDAEIGVAQANRDAGIREAECEKAPWISNIALTPRLKTIAELSNFRRLTLTRKSTPLKLRPNLHTSFRLQRSNRESGMRKSRYRL